jgi:hypothetical protein
MRSFGTWAVVSLALAAAATVARGGPLDDVIAAENKAASLKLEAMPVVNDEVFLRRVYVDLIGRIPTADEVTQFAAANPKDRREKLVEKLLADPRFSDRWTIFYADMLRLRSNAPGGAALIAYVHNAVQTGMPYDEMVRRLIATNGKAGKTPEAGFILGDDADPLAMASITSQVFLGVRIGCAQCHDHPFDVWKRRDFYDMAAFFGKTRRYESQLTRVIYATEAEQNTILWPPEGEATDSERKPVAARFPFKIEAFEKKPEYIARLDATRAAKIAALPKAKGPTVDDLLNDTAVKVNKATTGTLAAELAEADVKKDIRKIDINAAAYKASDLREQLARQVTDPRNKYFSRALVNRVWKHLVGRGFVEPVDDFRADNKPVHPQALDYLAHEFVASDYDLRTVVKLVVTSDAYQRGHAPATADELTRLAMEENLLATPMRRMIAESLYDSVVTAGHLFEVKHSPGKNEKKIVETVRVPIAKPGEKSKPAGVIASVAGGKPVMKAMPAMPANGESGYGLESAIELDFTALLKDTGDDEVAIDEMKAVSQEELEAQRMMMERMNRNGIDYKEEQVTRIVDDNPVFNTSLRMQSPAPDGHFLRVFGQPNRSDLGDLRDDSASMRQALMMLNGRITHEAARVGDLEPMYKLLTGKAPNPAAAVKLAYLEILTRQPTAAELSEGQEIVSAGATPLDGMADLRWVLMNCNEFRFLP